ncbi:MAG: hypothetical protein M3238_08395, partial [Actinomycetota bacterium]|nr:hypothetical protein [Actinomycetota bacterium]
MNPLRSARPARALPALCIVAAALAIPSQAAAGGASAPELPRLPSTIVKTFPLDTSLASQSQPPATQPSSRVGSDCAQNLSRGTQDREDFETGPQVHVIYMVPAGVNDERLDVNGTLECAVAAQNQWLTEQSEGLEWRFDTYLTQGTVGGVPQTVAALDITFIQSPQTAPQLDGAGEVSTELRARGFRDPNKRYLTYVASGASNGGVCGDAYYPVRPLDRPWSGTYAQVYINAPPGCRTNQFGTPGAPSFSDGVAQQELMHNDGMT